MCLKLGVDRSFSRNVSLYAIEAGWRKGRLAWLAAGLLSGLESSDTAAVLCPSSALLGREGNQLLQRPGQPGSRRPESPAQSVSTLPDCP